MTQIHNSYLFIELSDLGKKGAEMFVYVFKDTHITWLVLESSQTDAEFKSKMYISELIRKSLPCSVTQAFLDNRHLREHAALNPLNDLSVAVNMCSPLWFLYCKRKRASPSR